MPLKVLEWIKCFDLAQQALLIIFSQTTTTRLSKELLACIWPETHSNTQKRSSLSLREPLYNQLYGVMQRNVGFTCDWLLFPPPPPPPVTPPVPPLPALLDCWWLAISAILLSICSKRSRIDILNWLSNKRGQRRALC